MKKILLLFVIVLFSSFSGTVYPKPAESRVEVIYFYSVPCGECDQLKEEFFPPIRRKYHDLVVWKELNVGSSPEDLDLAVSLVLGDKKFGTLTPSVVIGKTVLSGSREIQSGMESAIDEALSSSQKNTIVPALRAEDKIPVKTEISLFLVVLAGLADGVNPCAFAAIAFLVSLMYVRSYSKKETIVVSLSYCLAVYIVYFLIGLGAFSALYAIKGFYRLSLAFKRSIGVMCLILGFISLYDFLSRRIKKNTGEFILSLPLSIRKRISSTIGSGLRHKSGQNMVLLSSGAFSVGVFVSLLEMICTGQMYLPTLVYISAISEYRTRAMTYIGLYNIMFVLPLLAVSAACVLGTGSQKLHIFLKRHSASLKLSLSVVFFALAWILIGL